VRLFKDIVLSRAKAYNAVALVDFVCTAMEQYYCRRLLDFSHSRTAAPLLWLGRLMKKAEYIQPSAIQTVSATEFYVPNSSDLELLYTVDVLNGVCTCVEGMFGRFCKHQATVMQHKPGMFSVFSWTNYLSHCYTIAWDRLSNQFFCLCMYVRMYVCMYVSVGTITVALFNRSSRNLVRTFGV